MSYIGDIRDWVVDHDDEVIERYLENLSDREYSNLLSDLVFEDKVFKEAFHEAIMRSKHIDIAQQQYITAHENETPDHRDA